MPKQSTEHAPALVPLTTYREYTRPEMMERAASFHQELQRRRSVRQFARRSVPMEVVEECLRAAGSAPSGANLQPWQFVVVSDPQIKRQIREAAEEQEREFYRRRATEAWLDALAPLGTDACKPFLEDAPCLIVIFAQSHRLLPDGRKVKNYYVAESVGIASGLLIAALHHAGLASLPYTPSPMRFLSRILGRPAHERPYLVLVVGYPAENATVPDIGRKSLPEIATFV